MSLLYKSTQPPWRAGSMCMLAVLRGIVGGKITVEQLESRCGAENCVATWERIR